MQVKTNDRENPAVILETKLYSKVLVTVHPRSSIFIATDEGKGQTKILTLINQTNEKMEIYKMENNMQWIDVSYEPFSMKRWNELMRADELPKETIQRPDGGDYIVILKLSPDAQVGKFSGEVTFHTNIGELKKQYIKVSGRVEGPIQFEPRYLGLGRILPNLPEPVVKEFTLTHKSKKPFKIKEIRTSKNFFTFKYIQNKDNSYKFIVTYKGGAPPGDLKGIIHVYTEEPDQRVDLHYAGKVMGHITTIPEYIALGSVKEVLDEPVIKEFLLESSEKKPFNVKQIYADQKFFEFDHTKHDDGSYTVRVQYNGGFTPGRISGTITVVTDDAIQQTAEIPYYGKVLGPIEVVPSFLDFGEIPADPEKNVVKQLVLTHGKEKPFEIEWVFCNYQNITFSINQTGDYEYTIDVVYEGGLPPGPIKGRILIKTNDPEQQKVRLDYKATLVD